MQYTTLGCDICRRHEDDICNTDTVEKIHRYKVKRERSYRLGGWDRVDICDDCLKVIRNAIKAKNQ